MPVYKDDDRNTWYVKCYYIDWTGEKKQKKKRGFKKKKDAKEWEDSFLVLQSKKPTIKFGDLTKEYLNDCKLKVRYGTLRAKENCLNHYILPYFKDKPASDITPESLRVWQNSLFGKEKIKGKGAISNTYIHNIKMHFSSVFSFGIKYYRLSENPIKRLDSLEGEREKKDLNFWQYDEFVKAMSFEKDIKYQMIFQMLFFGGFRISELLALWPSDLNDDDKSVNVTKSYNYIEGGHYYGPPKSKKGIRKVTLPDFLYSNLKQFIALNYLDENDRIFIVNDNVLRNHLAQLSKQADVPLIRIHDLRHSHVSHLISLGFSITEIADRIGDTADVVSKTYAHLYPEARNVIANTLANSTDFSEKSIFSTKIVP